MLASVLLGFLAVADGIVVEPCVDELTVRASPTLASARVGVIRRGTAMKVLETTHTLETIALTIDRNVPASIHFEPSDVWLKVDVAIDGGTATGWVYGGLVCRPTVAASDRQLSLIGWSEDNTRVAFIERASDSFACGFGRPATLRIVEVASGRELYALTDDCPAAELLISHRATLTPELRKHGIGLSWFVVSNPRPMEAALDAAACARGRFKGCKVSVLEKGAVRADLTVDLVAASIDGEGHFPAAQLVAVINRPGMEVAFVRVQSSAENHRYVARLLRAPVQDAWRDALAGVRLAALTHGCANGLKAETRDATAAKALEKLTAELQRRMEKHYRKLMPDQLCLVGASSSSAGLELEFVPQQCNGNECPDDACKRSLRFSVSSSFAVLGQRSGPWGGYTCDP